MENWPASKIEHRALTALKPTAGNARTHSDAQVEQIAKSIQEWGWTQPVLVDEADRILAGHGRYLAASKVGAKDVPVIVARGWTEEQKRAYMLADNQLALNAGWDTNLLKVEIAGLRDVGFNLDLVGFDAPFLADLMAMKVGLTDPDAVPEPPAVAASQAGDVWLLGPHRLVCGDCTDPAVVEACVGQEKPHLMVTDPPYGVNYDPDWRARAGVNLNRAKMGQVANDDCIDWRTAWNLFEGPVSYVWHAGRYASAVQASIESSGFCIRSQIIWAKDRFALSRGDYHWRHEPCWYAVRKGEKSHWQGDRRQDTVWEIPAREDDGHGHGTQKPVECVRRPIENNSNAGDAVYDPFVGSGTTIIAAEMTGRHCCAIEIDPVYVDVAVKRWEDFTGKKASREMRLAA